MTTRLHHRTLTDHLGGWGGAEIAHLLVRRPDLAQPVPPTDVAELAERAQRQSSVVRAIAETTLAENRLLQLVVCCRPDVPLDELAAALPERVELADLEETMVGLERSALLWRHDGRVHCSGALRHAMPTTLGPPLQALVKDQTVDYLKAVLKVLRRIVDHHAGSPALGPLPDPAVGPDGRPPRKAELVDELEALLAAPGVVGAVLSTGPPAAVELAARMAAGRPHVELQQYLYFSRYGSSRPSGTTGQSWLFERALLLPDGNDFGVQPREVGVALRGGRPVADMALDRPTLPVGAVEPEVLDAQAAARAVLTLDRLDDLLEQWTAAPAKALKSGGLGATVLKQVAGALDADPVEAGRLIELAHLAGLVEATTTSRKERRTWVSETFVGPAAGARDWLDQPVEERWLQLVTAWLRAEHWPSLPGYKPTDGTKAEPWLGYQYAGSAPERRRDVLGALADLAPGQMTDRASLAARVYWSQPHPWLERGVSAEVRIGWVYDEAELLGVVAGGVVAAGALSSAGRAFHAGNRRGAKQALGAAMPAPVRSFTLQADLTATVVGALDRDLLVELRLLADVESSGPATTWRFSDASLRRALDAGRDAESILAFFEAHADKGVPKPLAYLVGDVARRHGNLEIGTAGSFVLGRDPAVLADACSHRRTRKLALRVLAPTVAVSPHPPDKVLDGLRSAGFLPTVDGEDPASIALGDPVVPAPAAGRARTSTGTRLAEPFKARSAHRNEVTPLDEDTAQCIAEAIVAGPASPDARSGAGPSGRMPETGAVDPRFGLGNEEFLPEEELLPGDPFPESGPDGLAALLERAREKGRVVAILTEDREPDEPILLVVIGVDRVLVEGVDLLDGTPVSLSLESVTSAVDLGALDELANLVPLSGGRRRSSSRRGRRR